MTSRAGVTIRGRIRRFVLALAAAWMGAHGQPAHAAAQATRITALPASDVFAIRVVGDTIVAGMDTVVFVSTDGGTLWRKSSRPTHDAKLFDALWFENRRLYAGTFGTGVFISDDLGATWSSFNQGLVGGFLDTQLSIADLEARGDSLVAATFGAGVWVRNLAGSGDWQPFGDVFEPNQASNVDDLALGGNRLIACAGSNGTIFRRDPGDADWTISLLGNIGLRPGSTAQTALFTGSRWVVGTNEGVFFSASGEEPWTRSSTRLEGLSWSTFAQIGPTLFAAFDSVTTILMAESHDGAANWTVRERVTGPFAYQILPHHDDLLIARSDGLWIQPGVPVSTTAVDAAPRPLHFALDGPQPARERVRFRFDLPAAAAAAVEVFDVTGRRAASRLESSWSAGPHEVTLGARDLPPGIYNARLTSGRDREVVRFVHVP